MTRPASPCPFYGMPCQYVPMAHRTDELEQENAKLRTALWDIHAYCNNWEFFIWMWPIRHVKRLIRAALGGEHDPS